MHFLPILLTLNVVLFSFILKEVNLNSTNKYTNNTQNYYSSSPSTLIKPNMITNASSTFSSVDKNNKLVLNTTNNYPRRIRKETNL